MDAASEGPEGLTFVRGLRRSTIDALCNAAAVAIAIVNPGDGFVIGGVLPAIEAFEDAARRRGATRVTRVRVHIASHTRALAAASAIFATTLNHADVQCAPASGTRLFAGIDGSAVLDAATGIPKLADQISHLVEWARCLQSCDEAGASAFLELGPGHALSAMVSDAVSKARARSSDEFKTLAGLRSWIDTATQ